MTSVILGPMSHVFEMIMNMTKVQLFVMMLSFIVIFVLHNLP